MSLDLASTLTLRRQQRVAEAESKSKLEARPGWDATTNSHTIVRKVPPPRLNSRAPPPPRRRKKPAHSSSPQQLRRAPSAIPAGSTWTQVLGRPAVDEDDVADAEPAWSADAADVAPVELEAVRADAAQAVRQDEVSLVAKVDSLELRPAIASALKGIKSRMLRRQAVHQQLFDWMHNPDAGDVVTSVAGGNDAPHDGGGSGEGRSSAGDSARDSSPVDVRAVQRLQRRRPKRPASAQPRPGWNSTTFVEPQPRALVHTMLKDDDLEVAAYAAAAAERPAKEFPQQLYYASIHEQLRGEVMRQVEDEEYLEKHGMLQTDLTVARAPACAYSRKKSPRAGGTPRAARQLPDGIAQQVRMVLRAAEEKEQMAADLEARKSALDAAADQAGEGGASVGSRNQRPRSSSWQRGSFFGMYSNHSVASAAASTVASTPGERRRRRRRNYRESHIKPEDVAKHREYEERKGYHSGVRRGSIMEKSLMEREKATTSGRVSRFISGDLDGSERNFLTSYAQEQPADR